jgi:hypothetical protein
MGYGEIARIMGRSHGAIRSQACRLGIGLESRGITGSEWRIRRLLRQANLMADADAKDSNPRQDAAFQAAMRKAIAEGLEHVEEGVSLVPCTEYPVFVRPQTIAFSRSPSLMCAETGSA